MTSLIANAARSQLNWVKPVELTTKLQLADGKTLPYSGFNSYLIHSLIVYLSELSGRVSFR